MCLSHGLTRINNGLIRVHLWLTGVLEILRDLDLRVIQIFRVRLK